MGEVRPFLATRNFRFHRNDYIKRTEVLEYILRKILEEIAIEYSDDVLQGTASEDSIMEYSFTVVQFMKELTTVYPIIADFDIIPAPLLYDRVVSETL